MNITFSKHALEQIKRRKITQKSIVSTIENPEESIMTYRERELRRRQIGSKILEVIIKTEGDEVTVITAYYLKETYEN